jgi:hypothetical protein
MHYGKRLLCRVSKTLGKAPKTLGKAFAECCTQQRTPGREIVGTGDFAECTSSGTRQSLCRAQSAASANISSLPSANARQRFFRFCRVQTLSKDSSDFAKCKHSAKCLELPILICFFYFIHTYISEKHISSRRPPTSHLCHKHHIFILQTQPIHIHIPNRFTNVLSLQTTNMHVSQYSP